MARPDQVLGRLALGWMMLVGLLAGAFAIGETFDDPGGWAAVALSASWVLPTIALAAVGLRRPRLAVPVFGTATAVLVGFALADAAWRILPRDTGPVVTVAALALGVALAFVGRHRPGLAGALLVTLAAGRMLAAVVESAAHDGDRGWGAALSGSSGVLVLPLLVAGALFLLAAWSADSPGAAGATGPISPARPSRPSRTA